MRGRTLNNLPEIRAEVWKACGGICYHCGKALDPFTDFEVDHLHAICQGGSDTRENLVGSCRKCNRQRGLEARTPKPPHTFSGETLRNQRKALGLTQATLARLLEVRQRTISEWESGRVVIRHPCILDRALRDLERELKERDND